MRRAGAITASPTQHDDACNNTEKRSLAATLPCGFSWCLKVDRRKWQVCVGESAGAADNIDTRKTGASSMARAPESSLGF
jgi:hypothetical protein